MRFGKTTDGIEIVLRYEPALEKMKEWINQSEEMAPFDWMQVCAALVALASQIALAENEAEPERADAMCFAMLEAIMAIECGLDPNEVLLGGDAA